MEVLFEHAWSNTLTASLLAGAALLAGWTIRRPALTHALWVVVLVKLLTPGFAEIAIPAPWLTAKPEPAPPNEREEEAPQSAVATAQRVATGGVNQRRPQGEGASRAGDAWTARSQQMVRRLKNWSEGIARRFPAHVPLSPADSPSPDEWAPSSASGGALPAPAPAMPTSSFLSRGLNWEDATGPLIGAWWTGSLVWFAWSAWRVWRFRRWMSHGWLAPREIQRLTETLSERMGLKRAPRVFLASAPISPMVFWWGSSPRLLFPAELACRLDRASLESLLQHELAHLKRRDHWVRLVELAVTGLYWWHPLVWLARRRLYCVEEECCDALVVAQSRAGGRTYALALLSTLDFLAEWRPAFPPAACGLGRAVLLKRRLLLIMEGSVRGNLTRWGRVAVGTACLALPVSLQFVAIPQKAIATGAPSKLPVADAAATPAPIAVRAVPAATTGGRQPNWSHAVLDQTAMLLAGDFLVAVQSTADGAARIHVWRIETQSLVVALDEPRGVAALAVSPGGDWLIWMNAADVVKFAALGPIEAPAPFYVGESAAALAISRDLQALAVATVHGEILLWDPRSAQWLDRLTTLRPGQTPVAAEITSLSLSDDGQAIGAAMRTSTGPTTAMLWRRTTRTPMEAIDMVAAPPTVVLTPGDGDLNDALVSPDGRHFALLDSSGQCCVWETSNPAKPRLSASYHHVLAVGLSDNGQFSALSNRSHEAKIWSILANSRQAASQRSLTPRVAIVSAGEDFQLKPVSSANAHWRPIALSRQGERMLVVENGPARASPSFVIWQ